MRDDEQNVAVRISCVALLIWVMSALVSLAVSGAVVWGIVKLIMRLTAK